MLTSKRQEWILQMIKGPDIAPVGNCPGHYTSKGTIWITADDRKVTIRPADVLDLSNSEQLIVYADKSPCTIPWDRITNLDFDERVIATTPQRLHAGAAAHRIFPFSMRKKTV